MLKTVVLNNGKEYTAEICDLCQKEFSLIDYLKVRHELVFNNTKLIVLHYDCRQRIIEAGIEYLRTKEAQEVSLKILMDEVKL